MLYKLGGSNPVNDTLIESLEDANYDYINDKQKMLKSFNAAAKPVQKILTKATNIDVKGHKLTNDQAVRAYNHIKNPHLWAKMHKGGIDTAKMNEILDHMEKNPDLKTYASSVTDIYSQFLNETLNPKLGEDGRKQIQDRFMPTNLSAMTKQEIKADKDEFARRDSEGRALLKRVYGDNPPSEVEYTPFTAEGSEDQLTFDKLAQGDADYYSVMSDNLKARTDGGEYTFRQSSNMSDLRKYLRGPVHTANFLDFANKASAVFNNKNIKGMEGAFGKEWSDSMKDSLQRIVTGQSALQKDKTTRAVQGFINGTIGGIMFLNMKSAALQLLSFPNYFFSSPQAFTSGLGKGYWESMKRIRNSNWAKERGAGKTQLETQELFESEGGSFAAKGIRTMLEKGYFLTKGFDKLAIAVGGAAYLNGKYKQNMKDGMDSKDAFHQAMKQFIAQTEETQQSTRQERLGRQQTSGMGRAILAFANTPMQYNRLSWKAIKDIRAGKNIGGNLGKVAWYLGVQNAIFTSAQQALYAALDMEDEDEVETVLDGANSMLSTVLRGAGIYGALGSTLKDIGLGCLQG